VSAEIHLNVEEPILTTSKAETTSLHSALSSNSVYRRLRQIEKREWWLWACAVLVTLLLSAALASFLFVSSGHLSDGFETILVHPAIRGVVALVLLFDIYTVYQQWQIVNIRHQVLAQEKLFRLISENAGDMIALVDVEGHRLYNSPSYYRTLGYSEDDLKNNGFPADLVARFMGSMQVGDRTDLVRFPSGKS